MILRVRLFLPEDKSQIKSPTPSKEENNPTNGDSKREWNAFLIAAAVIAAFIVFLGFALTSPKYDNSLDDRIKLMKEVASILGGYVAAVLVYYFGQRQIQNLGNQVEGATKRVDDYRKHSLDAKRDVLDLISGGEEEIDITLAKLQKIKDRLEKE